MEAAGTSRTGYAVANLGWGNHTAKLQWKKRGGYVTSWNSMPSLDDGFSGGRVLTVTSHHRYMWTKEIEADDKISNAGTWVDMASSSLTFTLAEAATLRFVYAFNVRPDWVDPTDEYGLRDDVSARLVIDGEWSSSTRQNCINMLTNSSAHLAPPHPHTHRLSIP
tara:strand:+ start:143 stop:637 length:495 start_codon:yes stop_codon:yes gene_type:complete